MPFKLCDNGHYYNTDQYSTCPTCAEELGNGRTKTKTTTDEYISDPPSGTTPYQETVQPLNLRIKQGGTVLRGFGGGNVLPVVGWVVVVNGAGMGRDFRLVPGRNHVGRDSDMQICLDFGAASDMTVSGSEHAVIIYDVIDNEFYISQHSKSKNLPRLNGKGIRESTTLKAMDIILVGETQLMFIPLCGEAFQWGSESKKE